MKPWQLGNTSVRSATRLRDGLIVLAESGREGALRGPDGDAAWREILGEAGVVRLGEDASNSVGRKWRAAMCRLGFLYDRMGKDIQDQVGKLDYITPAGHRLIAAESLPAQQECFLRAMSGLWIDVRGAQHAVPGPFSPLRHVLRVMRALDEKAGTSDLGAIEFALFVQTSDENTPAEKVVHEILTFREKRKSAANKKRFDQAALDAIANTKGAVQASTYRDYMDMNLRYLKATGLFHAVGRGISLSSLKTILIDGLIMQDTSPGTAKDFWTQLTNGTVLPTDDLDAAKDALSVVQGEAKKRGLDLAAVPAPVDVADLNRQRLDVELELALDDEMKFYRAQKNAWPDIVEYMSILNGNRPDPDMDIEIPRSERPAYLEWTFWRAFLAINSLSNAPHQARRFAVDQDMLPMGHAPGGGPDMVFEFDQFVLVVEVTLTTGIRQEGAESVPVRHHVHSVQRQYPSKPVFGLFVAPSLANSTIATFHSRKWYPPDTEDEVEVFIIPVTVEQFQDLFVSMFKGRDATPRVVHELIGSVIYEADRCVDHREWRKAIDEIIHEKSQSLVA